MALNSRKFIFIKRKADSNVENIEPFSTLLSLPSKNDTKESQTSKYTLNLLF